MYIGQDNKLTQRGSKWYLYERPKMGTYQLTHSAALAGGGHVVR